MSEYTVTDYLLDRLAELGVDRDLRGARRLQPRPARPDRRASAVSLGRMQQRAQRRVRRRRVRPAARDRRAVHHLRRRRTERDQRDHRQLCRIRAGDPHRRRTDHGTRRPRNGSCTTPSATAIFTHFLAMHTEITCARAALTADNAVAEIDRVLTDARDRQLPGYLLLPADVAETPATRPRRRCRPRAAAPIPAALAAFTGAAGRLLAERGGVGEVARARPDCWCTGSAPQPTLTRPACGRQPPARHLAVGQESGRREPRHVRRHLRRRRERRADPAGRRGVSGADRCRSAVHRPEHRAVQPADHPQPDDRDRRRQCQCRYRDLRAGRVAATPWRTLVALVDRARLRERPAPDGALDRRRPPASPSRAPADATARCTQQHCSWESGRGGSCGRGDIVLADQGTCFYGMGPAACRPA